MRGGAEGRGCLENQHLKSWLLFRFTHINICYWQKVYNNKNTENQLEYLSAVSMKGIQTSKLCSYRALCLVFCNFRFESVFDQQPSILTFIRSNMDYEGRQNMRSATRGSEYNKHATENYKQRDDNLSVSVWLMNKTVSCLFLDWWNFEVFWNIKKNCT